VIRHEFLELLVRIAMDKYYKSGMVRSESEAVFRLLEVLSKTQLKKYDIGKWKWQRLYNEDCDISLTSKVNFLQTMYNKYSTKLIKPGEKIYLAVEDFLQFCADTEQFTALFTARQATMCFHLAMMHQVNEVDSDRHVKMTFFEFVEAFAMIVECADSDDPETALFNFEQFDKTLYEKLEDAFLGLQSYIRRQGKARSPLLPSLGVNLISKHL
jgi:hypothetical protein